MSKDILFEFDNICKELDVTYCLIMGTALGFYREGNFIQGDLDIDVGVFCEKEKLERLFKKMGERGFELQECHCNVIDEGYELSRHTTKGILLDITFKPEVSRRKFYEKFDKVIFEGREFNLPHPIEEYLGYEYSNWKVKSDEKCRGQQKGKTPHPYLIGKSIEFDIEEFWKNERS